MITDLVIWVRRYRAVNLALADQAIISASNFLAWILLARLLGIEEFGRFTLYWIVAEFFHSIQHASIILPMMAMAPKQAASDRRLYLGALLVQQGALTIIVTLLLIIGLLSFSPIVTLWRLDDVALPLVCVVLSYQCQNFVRRYFFVESRWLFALICDIIRYPGQILVLIVLFHQGELTAAQALWIIAVVSTLSSAIGLFGIERPEWDKAFIAQTLKRHWDFAKWLISSEVVRWATQNLMIMVAGAVLGVAAVGGLQVTRNLVGAVNILLLGLENVVPVRAAQLFHEHGREALVRYLKGFLLFGGLAIAMIVAIPSVAPVFWINLLYGAEYVDHAYLVRWWAAVFIIIFLNRPPGYGLRTIEITAPLFWANFWVAVFAILFSYPLAYYFGIIGVIVGILFVNLLRTVFVTLAFKGHIAKFP